MDIHNIKARYEFKLPMVNDEYVFFRPVIPEDREILQKGMQDLSKESRHFRFFSPIQRLPDILLNYLTNVDQDNHVAWIAFTRTKANDQAVGISRYVRLPDDLEIAEIAMVILDSFQKKGLGTHFMALLYFMASIKGIKILRAIVLAENEIMSNWLGQLGAIGKFENSTYKMDLAVNRDFSLLPATPAAQKLRVALEKITRVSI